jgi:hypothetical protein
MFGGVAEFGFGGFDVAGEVVQGGEGAVVGGDRITQGLNILGVLLEGASVAEIEFLYKC